MSSIVQELASWLKDNAPSLRMKGMEIIERIPESNSNFPWKASVGISYDGILIEYAVWERTIFQTDLIVVNTHIDKTIIMKEATPSEAEIVHRDLSDIAENLLDGTYRNLTPNPRIISNFPKKIK